jgi:acyl carrier protein
MNKILADNFEISKSEVLENLTMDDISSWDSLTHMGLIVSIEKEFSIELSGDDIADMTSCDAIRTIVAKYI